MRAFATTAIIVLTLFFMSKADAGNWGMGGGTLLLDKDNPWFLNNISVVNYCIALDRENVSASEEQIDSVIQQAVRYWREEFSFASYSRDADKLRGAQQRFVRNPCPARLEDALATMDLVFQFGVLTQQQRAFLEEPRNFIAVSVRTDYNRKTMHGRGFIYVSPDAGPLRYRGDHLLDNAWSAEDGVRLLHVVAHELGHVFGMGHFGQNLDIMGAGHPKLALLPEQDGGFSNSMGAREMMKNLGHFFKPAEQMAYGASASTFYCIPKSWEDDKTWHGILQPLLKFFFLDETLRCVRVRVIGEKLEVHYKLSEDGPEILAGTAALEVERPYRIDEITVLSSIAVTAEQSFIPMSGEFQIPGPGIIRTFRSGVYHSIDGSVSRPLQVSITPTSLTVGGLDGDKIFFNAFLPLKEHN